MTRAVTRHVAAHEDPSLRARVLRRVGMLYAGGADAATDRPPHVRSASGIAWVGDRLAVIQDDASFLALVDPATGIAEAVPLPAGADGVRLFDDARGNKAGKLDHEALLGIGEPDGAFLLAIGSGSTERRERIAMIEGVGTPSGATTRVRHVPALYAGLRAATGFAGSELNVEGAILLGDRIRLFGRGNGAVRGELRPVSATCDLDWSQVMAHLERPDGARAPEPRDIVEYDLGALGDAPLTFTDAALLATRSGRVILYAATAEASPDVTRDGEVSGSAIGVIEERDGDLVARWAELRGAAGEPLAVKVEGIVPSRADAGRLFAVIDHDAHDRPSELCEVRLDGEWPGPAAYIGLTSAASPSSSLRP